MNYTDVNTIMRSVGTALLLTAANLNPLTDYAEIPDVLDPEERRPGYAYEGQFMSMTYGGFGTMLVPGIVAEFGRYVDNYGRRFVPVILSLSRFISDGSTEREQGYISRLAMRLEPVIFNTQSFPVYSFGGTDDEEITGIIGNFTWPEKIYSTPRPVGEMIGNFEAGGWVRYEFRFTGSYALVY